MPEPIVIPVSIDADAVKQQAELASQAVVDAFENAIPSAIEKTNAKLAEVARKQEVIRQVIKDDQREIELLESKRASASESEIRNIDKQIEKYKQLVAGREIQILKDEERRVKLEETSKLSQASTDAEKDNIRLVTDLQTINIAQLRDKARAIVTVTEKVKEEKEEIKKVKEEQEESTESATNYFAVYGAGAAIVTGVLGTVKQYLQATREEAEAAIAAGNQARALTGKESGSFTRFFNDSGITSGASQTAARDTLAQLQAETHTPDSMAAAVAGDLAAPLHAAGIDPSSAQGQGLLSTGMKLAGRGIDTAALSPLLQKSLAANPNLTGDEFNQMQSDRLAAVGGSASRLNLLNQTLKDTQGRGLSDDDTTRMFVQMGQNGISADQIPNLINQASLSMKTLRGMSSEKREGLSERLSEQGINGLGGLLSGNGSITPEAFLGATAGLSSDQRDTVEREFGMSRGLFALNAANGYQGVSLPSGSSRVGISENLAQRQATAKDMADVSGSKLADTDSGFFSQALKNETERLTNHPELLPFGASGFSRGVSLGQGPTAADTAKVNVASQEFLKLVKYRQQLKDSGTKLTALEQQKLDSAINGLGTRIGGNLTAYDANPELTILAHGVDDRVGITDDGGAKDGRSVGDILKGIGSDPSNWIDQRVKYWGNGTDATEDRGTAAQIDAGESLMNKKRSGPSTKPAMGPTSINYHSINYNYNTSYSALGDVTSSDNRYS
jgi:hypothetical protein